MLLVIFIIKFRKGTDVPNHYILATYKSSNLSASKKILFFKKSTTVRKKNQD
jgi:hypothetical protein